MREFEDPFFDGDDDQSSEPIDPGAIEDAGIIDEGHFFYPEEDEEVLELSVRQFEAPERGSQEATEAAELMSATLRGLLIERREFAENPTGTMGGVAALDRIFLEYDTPQGTAELRLAPDDMIIEFTVVDPVSRTEHRYFKGADGAIHRDDRENTAPAESEGAVPYAEQVRRNITAETEDRTFKQQFGDQFRLVGLAEASHVAEIAVHATPMKVSFKRLMDIAANRAEAVQDATKLGYSPEDVGPSVIDAQKAGMQLGYVVRNHLAEAGIQLGEGESATRDHDYVDTVSNGLMHIKVSQQKREGVGFNHPDTYVHIEVVQTAVSDTLIQQLRQRGIDPADHQGITTHNYLQYAVGIDDQLMVRRLSTLTDAEGEVLWESPTTQTRGDLLEVFRVRNFLHDPQLWRGQPVTKIS